MKQIITLTKKTKRKLTRRQTILRNILAILLIHLFFCFFCQFAQNGTLVPRGDQRRTKRQHEIEETGGAQVPFQHPPRITAQNHVRAAESRFRQDSAESQEDAQHRRKTEVARRQEACENDALDEAEPLNQKLLEQGIFHRYLNDDRTLRQK